MRLWMDIIIKEETLIKKGIMKKSPFEMTDEEKEAWKSEASERARAYLFSIGQPLVYEKNGQLVAEYSDGRIKKI